MKDLNETRKMRYARNILLSESGKGSKPVLYKIRWIYFAQKNLVLWARILNLHHKIELTGN